jgi:hypothetical protein
MSSPKEEGMSQITYAQAAELLDVSPDTIRHAVLNGKLTRCTDNLKRAMLLEGQVALFKGKRISERALSLEEKRLWERYKQIAENPQVVLDLHNTPISRLSDIDRVIVERIVEIGKQLISGETALFESVVPPKIKHAIENPPYDPAVLANSILKDINQSIYEVLDSKLAGLDKPVYEAMRAIYKPHVDRGLAEIAEKLEGLLTEVGPIIEDASVRLKASDNPS